MTLAFGENLLHLAKVFLNKKWWIARGEVH